MPSSGGPPVAGGTTAELTDAFASRHDKADARRYGKLQSDD